MSRNTIRAYRADLNGLLEAVEREHRDVDLEVGAARYLNDARNYYEPRTVRRKLTAFRTFGRWAGRAEFLASYKPPKPPEAEPHPLPEGIAGLERMIATTYDARKRGLVALCGLCGLRVDEAVRVRPEHFDLDERTLKVRGKGDKFRIVPVSARAWQVLEPAYDWALEHGATTLVAIGERQARRDITEMGRRAGLSRRVSSHDLRATFATAVYDQGKDLRAVQQLLGHASSVTSEVYTGVTKATLRAAVEVS